MESNLFFLSVFLAGVLSFFSPCIFPLLPVYIGLLLDGDEEPRTVKVLGRELAWTGLVKTLCFIAGISLIFFILGFGAGFLGSVLYDVKFRYAMGILIILLGLHQMEIIQFRQLQKQKTLAFKKDKQRNAFLSSFLLGISFSFGWTPCIGPVLSSVLALSAAGGQGSLQGALLTLVYTLGMALPFLVLALASSLVMRYFGKIKPYMGLLKKIGGALIILMGILLMLGQLNALSGLFQ